MPLQNKAVDLPQRHSSGASTRTHPQREMSVSEVILHVYDLTLMTKRMNIGTFHLAIEVYGQEIFFSVEGILSCKPAGHQKHIHRQTMFLGRTFLKPQEVKSILEQMGQDWKGSTYNIIGRNCQTFAVEFADLLGLGDDCIPEDFRRQSDLGAGWRGSSVGGATAWMLNRVLGSAGSQSLGSASSQSGSI